MCFSCAASRAAATCLAISSGFGDGERPPLQALGEVLPFDELEGEEGASPPSGSVACSKP